MKRQIFFCLLLWMQATLWATSIGVVAPSTIVGPTENRGTYPIPQGSAALYDTAGNLAYSGNGFALAAVAKDLIPGYPAIHDMPFANDGYYGNGTSWISATAGSWIKIDLGRVVSLNAIQFGRDRLYGFDDRDPGQFTIDIALTDNVYAAGNEVNDSLEYTRILNSSDYGFSGIIQNTETIRSTFTSSYTARFIKLTFTNAGTAIDEIEVFGTAVPEASSFLMMSLCLGLAWWRKRVHRKNLL